MKDAVEMWPVFATRIVTLQVHEPAVCLTLSIRSAGQVLSLQMKACPDTVISDRPGHLVFVSVSHLTVHWPEVRNSPTEPKLLQLLLLTNAATEQHPVRDLSDVSVIRHKTAPG